MSKNRCLSEVRHVKELTASNSLGRHKPSAWHAANAPQKVVTQDSGKPAGSWRRCGDPGFPAHCQGVQMPQCFLAKTRQHIQKDETRSLPSPHTKANSKWITDLLENMKFLEENGKFFKTLVKDFLDETLGAKTTKVKIDE